MKFLIIPNITREKAVDFAFTAAETVLKKGHRFAVMPEAKEIFSTHFDKEISDDIENADMAVVIGGDGTVLRNARTLLQRDIPIWAVNFGHLGYLTDCEPEEAMAAFDRIFSGDYKTENRITLIGCVDNNGQKEKFLAVNEAVIYRAGISRALNMDLTINDKFIQRIQADGIIVATPTGSTAYNLSAGGPILLPEADNMVITSICQSLISLNSVVIAGSDVIKTKVHLPALDEYELDRQPMLVLDGCARIKIADGADIIIKKSDKVLKLIKTGDDDFYKILQMKLAK